MPKLDEQIKTLAGYFAADCEPDGKLTLQLEVEHFLTRSDGQPPAFADVQAALRDLQQQTDAPIITDGEYFGYSGPAAAARSPTARPRQGSSALARLLPRRKAPAASRSTSLRPVSSTPT